MKKELELSNLKREYASLLGKTDKVIERQEQVEKDSSDYHLLEDQYCAMRLYEKALYDRILYIEDTLKEKRNSTASAKKAKGQNPKQKAIELKGVSLSDKDVDEILQSLCRSISEARKASDIQKIIECCL